MKGHKNLHLMANGMAGLLSCLLLFSCNNDDYPIENESGKASENICFGISSDEANITRGISGTSKEDGRTVSRFVLRSEVSADTLCVRASVSDGIVSSAYTNEKAMTRGVPITSLNAFHVSAYWKKDGNLQNQFFMDETATENGNDVWNTENIYYWPGAAHTLQFYAYAPADAGFTTPTSSSSTTLADYTVPADVVQQRDIVVANTTELSGNNNQVVPLQFKHICTAVRFVVGSEIQPGTITNITLRGVKGSGSYDMANSRWTLGETVADFSQSPNKTTDGNTTEGDEITTAEGTFMMLPQTLAEGASVEIVFHDNMSNQDRTLTASIAGQEWSMGKTVTYKLSISPEYDMNIEVPEDDKVQDAHYVSFPITVNVEDFTGNWTLTSNLPNDVFFTATQTDLQKQGYWIDEDKGQPSITGTGNGTFTYYVYATENVADVARDIELQIKPADNAQAVPSTATVQQLCPSWNGTLGCERIEDGDYPWGFLWDADMKITYNMQNTGLGDLIKNALINAYLSWFTNYDYITKETWLLSITSVTIDFSKVPVLNVAKSETDGLKNTSELYNFNGVSDASSLMQRLESWGGVPDKTLPQNPTEFAARACAMKNKYNKTTKTQGGQTVEKPSLKEENLVWYLPAKNEAPSMADKQYSLNGDYWTSTAGGNNQTAYKFTAGQTTADNTVIRTKSLHVRAVRKK